MKAIITIRSDTKGIFDQFMGRGKLPSAYRGTFLAEVNSMVEKKKKTDETASYTFIETENEKNESTGAIITITGSDETVKDTYRQSKKHLDRYRTKIYLKSMRTQIKAELIE